MALDLAMIARKWHTDKVLDPANRYSHDYIPEYERLLDGRDVRKILEIGLGWKGLIHAQYVSGASLFMWAEAFPKAFIYGLDVREDALVNDGRIHSLKCDQSDVVQLQRAKQFLGRNFDLIVDDGSHVPIDQATTARAFFPLLAHEGIYVIEDVAPGDECSVLLERYGIEHKIKEFRTDRVENDRLIIMRAARA